MSSHFGTGDRVRVMMAIMTSARGLCTSFKRQAITLVETTQHYLDEFEGLSVAHNFAGGQNDNNK